MKRLKDTEKRFWQEYLLTGPKDIPENPHVEASYAGDRAATDNLLNLYLSGKKTAGSSIVEDFLSNGDPVPKVGNYWILLNSKDQPCCILQTVRVAIYKFRDTPAEIALAEAEGDRSLDYWKSVHRNFYSPFLKAWNVTDIEDATVVTEFFKIVHP